MLVAPNWRPQLREFLSVSPRTKTNIWPAALQGATPKMLLTCPDAAYLDASFHLTCQAVSCDEFLSCPLSTRRDTTPLLPLPAQPGCDRCQYQLPLAPASSKICKLPVDVGSIILPAL